MPDIYGAILTTNSNAVYMAILFFVELTPFATAITGKRADSYWSLYKSARIPVIPVAKGVSSTKKRIAIYTALLLVVSIAPYISGMAGVIFFIFVITAGIYYLWLA